MRMKHRVSGNIRHGSKNQVRARVRESQRTCEECMNKTHFLGCEISIFNWKN